MDEITRAIMAASVELTHDYGWTLDDGCQGELPTEASTFVRVMRKHLAPFGENGHVKSLRIAALRAELDSLEATYRRTTP